MNSLTGLPALSVELNDAMLAARELGALEEIHVEQRLSLPMVCELAFVNAAPDFVDAALAGHGQKLRITIPGSAAPLFTGELTAVTQSYESAHSSTLRLRGYDLLHRLRKRQPTRVHVQTSVAELAGELTSDLGLTVEPEADGPLLKRLIQHCQSDLDLLLEALEPCGLYVTLRDDVIHILSLAGFGEPLPLQMGEELLEARLTVNGDAACRSVSTFAWDPSRVERHTGRASVPRSGRTATASAPPECFASSSERHLTAEFAEDDSQAEAMAQAELDRRAAREVTLWGSAEGDSRLMPGAVVTLGGVPASLAGAYVLTSVTHRIGRSTGFVSEFSTEPPQPRPRSGATTIALGIVTRVNDPEGLGRVRVSLPAHGDLETDWMSVLSPGAGAGKGYTVLPDTGDQVVVLFAHDRNSHGIVLGGLYGSANPPDSVVHAGAVTRYSLRTHGGQKLIFDDGARSVRLEDPAGNFFEFSPDLLKLHSVVPLEIEAIGQPVAIRGKEIHFEEA
ncbi:MAG TPA: phage baseplate assembly protein V [Bryobacteraceae bacterium]|nr:phage baseplate assembly protein V [Bryobacteraceae bacterium]